MSAATLKPPRRASASVRIALLVAVLLVGVAVVAVHDLVVSQGWASGSPWVAAVLDSLDGLSASTGLAVAGAVLALVGLVVLLLALRRGPRTHSPVSAAHDRVPDDADLWLTPGAIGALAREVADRQAGVVSATTGSTGRRRVVVEIEGREHPPAALPAVRQAVQSEVGELTSLRLHVRPEKKRKATR